MPVIEALAATVPISIDTMKPAVARAAIAAGAVMWNDVTALRHAPGSLETAAELGCAVVLMHMQGEPATMQDDPRYDDVLAEVVAFLEARAEVVEAAGVGREKIWLDPGIGFGKSAAHNFALLRGLGRDRRPGLAGAAGRQPQGLHPRPRPGRRRPFRPAGRVPGRRSGRRAGRRRDGPRPRRARDGPGPDRAGGDRGRRLDG